MLDAFWCVAVPPSFIEHVMVSNTSHPSTLIKSLLNALSYFHVFDNGSLDFSQYRDKADQPIIFSVLLTVVFLLCMYISLR